MRKSIDPLKGTPALNLKSTRVLSGPARGVVEMLERRTLLSVVLSGSTLEITGSSNLALNDDGRQFYVSDMVARIVGSFLDSQITSVIVNPGTGGDTLSVWGTTKPVTIIGGGLDTVNIGLDGSVDHITGVISVSNPNSFTALTIDDSKGSTLDSSGDVLTPSQAILEPAIINYDAGQLSSLSIRSDNFITIQNTPLLHNGVPTIVSAGLTTIDATTGPLTVNPSESVFVSIGQGNGGSLAEILAPVVVNNPKTVETFLGVDDQNDPIGRNGLISSGGPDSIVITGMAPAPITYNGVSTNAQLDLQAGLGNDTITVGADAIATIIDGGGGNDTIIDKGGSSHDSINGSDGNDTLIYSDSAAFPVFDGGSGNNAVTLDQTNASFASKVSIGAGTISDSGFSASNPAHFTFNSGTVNQINILLGSGNDSVIADPSVTVPPSIRIPMKVHGGAGNDFIQGGGGNDSLYGDAGNDTLIAGAGIDSLGNDSLNGGSGNDVLIGDNGIDTLDGGDGAPVQIIADNIGAVPVNGSQGVALTGNWIASTSNSGFYASNYITDNNSLKGTKSVTFTPNIPTSGSYQIYARWPAGANRATHVPFSVTHQGMTSTIFENQQTNNNAWVLLGTFALNAGTSSSVMVSNTGTTGYVIVDAVRFVPVAASASISGTVFNDANGNGKQDVEEVGIHNRVVYIDSNRDGILDNNEPQTTSDAAGYWAFNALPAGTYRIREQNVAGVRHTDPPGSANFYDVIVTTGSTASAIYGKLFGEQEMTAAPVPVLAINASGSAFVLNSGVTYSADSGFTGGTAATTVFDVGNTDNDPIYYSYRSGASFSYSLAAPDGNYSLVLNFVDPTKTAAGQRKFNVSVQGSQVLRDFDIVASAGPRTAISKAFAVTVTNGMLTISLSSVLDSAILSGIVLYSA